MMVLASPPLELDLDKLQATRALADLDTPSKLDTRSIMPGLTRKNSSPHVMIPDWAEPD